MLKASRLSRRSVDGARLLSDLSIELRSGDRVALTGPSGAGKTLLMRALVLLDPVDDGHVRWRGSVPRGEGVPAFRRQVIYLQQRPMISETDVESQLRVPWGFKSAGGRPFDRGRAEDLLARAGRDGSFLAQVGTNLSGGEAQLVALVRALLLDPAVVLLDEPTSAMDAATRQAAEALLTEWIETDETRAWLWASHDREQLVRTCRRQVTMESGRLTA